MAGHDTIAPDLCVIGGGTAGSAMALAGIGLGLSCVLVEKRLPLGRGLFADIMIDGLIGAAAGEDFGAVRERVGLAAARAMPACAVERLRAAGVRVIEAAGRFTGRASLSAGPLTVRARRFVLATGARAALPPIPGLDVIRYRTPDALAGLARVPERLVVVGSHPQACELAQAFRRLGSAVTLVGEPPAVDPELWALVRTALVRDGVDLRPGPVDHVEPRGAGAVVHLRGLVPGALEATEVVVAHGLQPVTDGIGLSRAGVDRADGLLVLRPNLRTSNARVFAVGDVLGPGATGPSGLSLQVGTVLRAAFLRQPVRYAPERVARVLRTVPRLAETGLREEDARAGGDAVRVYRAPLADAERGQAAPEIEGHLKVVTQATGRVLGAGVVGPRAEDLIAPWVLAVSMSMPLDAMAGVPFAQPSLSDASRRVALARLVARLRSPWVRRFLAAVRRLG